MFGLRWAQKTKPCFVTLRTFFSPIDCRSKQTLTGYRPYSHSETFIFQICSLTYWLMTHDSWLMTHDSWLIDSFDSLILHTRFLLKQQQNCHAQIQQDFLANSSPTEFLCLPISSNILHFWQSFALFNDWLTLAQKDLLWFFRSLGCIATLKASSACFTAFPLSNVIVSELNLRQAQNKSSNICSCSSLKCWKGINKNAIFTWWRHRKD